MEIRKINGKQKHTALGEQENTWETETYSSENTWETRAYKGNRNIRGETETYLAKEKETYMGNRNMSRKQAHRRETEEKQSR